MSIYSETIRRLFNESDEIRNQGLVTPETVQRWDDILYGTRGDHPKWQLLDVYRPKDIPITKKLPVIINVHGGGWVQGDKNAYQYYCMSLVKYGFAVVNFSYRLAPEYTFPAPLEDLAQVQIWVNNHAEEYGFDVDQCFGIGDSAGGHILCLYTALKTNCGASNLYEFLSWNTGSFIAIALNCTSFLIPDVDQMDRMTKNQLQDFIGEPLNEQHVARLNAKNYITANFPPVYITSCVKDFLREHPKYIIEELNKYNIPVEYEFWGTDENPLKHVFHLDLKLKESEWCNEKELMFFKKLNKN